VYWIAGLNPQARSFFFFYLNAFTMCACRFDKRPVSVSRSRVSARTVMRRPCGGSSQPSMLTPRAPRPRCSDVLRDARRGVFGAVSDFPKIGTWAYSKPIGLHIMNEHCVCSYAHRPRRAMFPWMRSFPSLPIAQILGGFIIS
jgi:hypothetical protein